MKIEPDGPRRCLVHGRALGYRLAIDGLGAPDLSAYLRGTGDKPDWFALAGGDGIGADLTSAEPDQQGPVIRRELPDGRLETRSGGPGRVIARCGIPQFDRILPQSLHLLLAQQWARAGIMTLHAAAVSTPGGGILILGPRGAGKSTLTVSALAAGLGVITDDWMILGRATDGQIEVERLRGFLMLRHSWAAEQLSLRCPELQLTQLAQRPKQVMDVPGDRSRFPAEARIKAVWLLQRPRAARSEHSRLGPASPACILRRLVESSMPLLFSAEFGHEHRALLDTARQLISSAPCQALEPGTDIVSRPAQAWSRLLSAALAA